MLAGEGALPADMPAPRQAALDQHANNLLSSSPVVSHAAAIHVAKLRPVEQAYVQAKAQQLATPPVFSQQVVTPALSPSDTAGLDRYANQAANRLLNFSVPGMRGGGGGGGFSAKQQLAGTAAHRIVQLAHEYLGTPYVWGGESPKGFDCSGFAQFLYSKVGVAIPRTTYTQWQTGRAVSQKNLRPGDLVFFKGSDSRGGLPGHVGIYIGDGMMIDAPHTGSSVRVESVFNFGGYMGARRYGKA